MPSDQSPIVSAKAIQGCFVTGTDTGVGKTLVIAALAHYLRQQGLDVGVMKPIETGCEPGGSALSDGADGARLQVGIGNHDPSHLVTPYRFPDPLAPLAAAERAGMTIQPDRIVTAFKELAARHRCLLVEGVGGVMVPIAEGFDVRDLIARLGLPVLIVGRAALGGVNHALLTVEALQQRGIPVLAILLNRPAGARASTHGRLQEESTAALLRKRHDIPLLGPLRHEPLLEQDWTQGVTRIAADPVIRELAGLVTAAGRYSSGPRSLRQGPR
ncbi:MAG: dethiobiotin synthase [Nitrospira sp.]|nr:dethiobiotin synthase [Nitrospira sp.]